MFKNKKVLIETIHLRKAERMAEQAAKEVAAMKKRRAKERRANKEKKKTEASE